MLLIVRNTWTCACNIPCDSDSTGDWCFRYQSLPKCIEDTLRLLSSSSAASVTKVMLSALLGFAHKVVFTLAVCGSACELEHVSSGTVNLYGCIAWAL